MNQISELQNLQALICSANSLFISFPEKIWMMKNLRYIHIRETAFLPSPKTESLVTAMPNLEELSSLSYISCTNEVFSGIPNLKRLTIHHPSVTFNHSPDWLMDMSSLRKLEAIKCYCLPVDCNWHKNLSIKSFVFPTSLKTNSKA